MPEQIDVHEHRRELTKELTREQYEEWVAEHKRECRRLRKTADRDRTIAGDREIEIEFALGYDMPQLLSYVLEKEGSFRGARRYINSELEAASHYDTDEYGKVAINTLYEWIDKWVDADKTLESDRKVLQAYDK